MKDEKEIVWTEDMGFMPPVKKIEGRTICRVECQLSEYKEEIERLRDALRWAAPYVKDDPRVSAIIKAALKEKE